MNLLLSCIGKRGYIAAMFRDHLEKGDRIIGTGNTRWTSGFHSCDASYVMPDIADPAYVDAVIELCHKEKIDGMLSLLDLDVHRLSGHIDSFTQAGVTSFIPRKEVADIAFDKVQACEFLEGNGFSTPRTFTNLGAVRNALRNSEIEFPLYVKPRMGFGSRNTFQARDMHQVEVFFGLEDGMIVQPGLGGLAFNFDILNDLEGRVISIVPWRRFLSVFGETERAETVESPTLLKIGEKLASSLRFAGPLDADLYVEGDQVHILDINPRFGGGYPVSHLAGAGFPGKIVSMLRGETVMPTIGDYQRGVVMIKELGILGGDREEFFRDTLKIVQLENP